MSHAAMPVPLRPATCSTAALTQSGITILALGPHCNATHKGRSQYARYEQHSIDDHQSIT